MLLPSHKYAITHHNRRYRCPGVACANLINIWLGVPLLLNITGVVKKTNSFAWEVPRIKGNAAAFFGLVKAPDEKAAIKAAIAEFKIINPEHQKRLAARRQS